MIGCFLLESTLGVVVDVCRNIVTLSIWLLIFCTDISPEELHCSTKSSLKDIVQCKTVSKRWTELLNEAVWQEMRCLLTTQSQNCYREQIQKEMLTRLAWKSRYAKLYPSCHNPQNNSTELTQLPQLPPAPRWAASPTLNTLSEGTAGVTAGTGDSGWIWNDMSDGESTEKWTNELDSNREQQEVWHSSHYTEFCQEPQYIEFIHV